MKNDHFIAFLIRVPDRQNFSVFPYIHYVPMARRKDFYPILIVYFEDKVKDFLKTHSIIFYECLVREFDQTQVDQFWLNGQN
jgi:hypothetical protein